MDLEVYQRSVKENNWFAHKSSGKVYSNLRIVNCEGVNGWMNELDRLF